MSRLPSSLSKMLMWAMSWLPYDETVLPFFSVQTFDETPFRVPRPGTATSAMKFSC